MFRCASLIVMLALMPGCALVDRTTTALSNMFRQDMAEANTLPEVPEVVAYRIPNSAVVVPPATANTLTERVEQVPEAVSQANPAPVAPAVQRNRVTRMSPPPAPTRSNPMPVRASEQRIVPRADFISVPTSSARSMPVTSTPWNSTMPDFSSARMR